MTAGITAEKTSPTTYRLPIILPLFPPAIAATGVQFTYIPGTYNNGNVLFAWLRYGFKGHQIVITFSPADWTALALKLTPKTMNVRTISINLVPSELIGIKRGQQMKTGSEEYRRRSSFC